MHKKKKTSHISFQAGCIIHIPKTRCLDQISEESSELFPFTVWVIFERERPKAAFCIAKCTSQTQEYMRVHL